MGFAFLGVGLGCVVPTVLSAAGDVSGVHAGRAVAAVAGCGWAGFVVGPVVLGGIASASSLHVALFVIPFLTAIVAVATGLTAALRRGDPPVGNTGGMKSNPPPATVSELLTLCTGNAARSVMAGAMLESEAALGSSRPAPMSSKGSR